MENKERNQIKQNKIKEGTKKGLSLKFQEGEDLVYVFCWDKRTRSYNTSSFEETSITSSKGSCLGKEKVKSMSNHLVSSMKNDKLGKFTRYFYLEDAITLVIYMLTLLGISLLIYHFVKKKQIIFVAVPVVLVVLALGSILETNYRNKVNNSHSLLTNTQLKKFEREYSDKIAIEISNDYNYFSLTLKQYMKKD